MDNGSKLLDILSHHFVGVSLGADINQLTPAHGKATVIITPIVSDEPFMATVQVWYTVENGVVNVSNLERFIADAKMAMGAWFVRG